LQRHLELDLSTSTADGAGNYIGLSLVLEKILWRNDKRTEIFINAQLLDVSGGIFESISEYQHITLENCKPMAFQLIGLDPFQQSPRKQ
jgi:hypothetical protein